ncbi:MAG: hypothetical protein M3Z24_12800 [Chloroflexota bacterium]|nr:hypothetical protein [Chloroflexota bacterium]
MMSIQSRRELLATLRPRYIAASRSQKQVMLDEFVCASGYHRKYAISLLSVMHPLPTTRRSSHHKTTYGLPVQAALIRCWAAANFICSKRLVPFLGELSSALERHGELHLDEPTRVALASLSPATADRLLRKHRLTTRRHGLGTTKPGTLLRKQIPVRTFSEHDQTSPGSLEIDLVAHCGLTTAGEYLNTLTLTDIFTTWTEEVALCGRSQASVHAAIEAVRTRLPFKLREIDSDNGSEFINANLLRYAQANQINFTRSRPYKKNDQAHVEQKNWSVVRQTVGYDRYEAGAAYEALRELYEVLRLYLNYYQPSMKLVSKQRVGGHVKKVYDKAQTPYARVMASEAVDESVKAGLREQYAKLNPVKLLAQLRVCQSNLWEARVRSTNEATIPSK